MASRTTETPPSSQALQRRLIVDRKQCVYSDLPRRNRRGSEGEGLHKQSFPTKNLATARSHDKVVMKSDSSDSSVATSSDTSKRDKPQNTALAPPSRRQSIHAMIERESPLRRGAKTCMITHPLSYTLSFVVIIHDNNIFYLK